MVPEQSPLVVFDNKCYVCVDNNGKDTKHIIPNSWIIHLFIYIRDNNNLFLMWYSKIYYSRVSDLLRQDMIKTENQLMVFYDSRWQDCPYIGRSTVAYIVFHQGLTIDRWTHYPGTFSQSSAESEYTAACTSGIDLVHFRILNNEFLYKVPGSFP